MNVHIRFYNFIRMNTNFNYILAYSKMNNKFY